jgi:hypothetical protein
MDIFIIYLEMKFVYLPAFTYKPSISIPVGSTEEILALSTVFPTDHSRSILHAPADLSYQEKTEAELYQVHIMLGNNRSEYGQLITNIIFGWLNEIPLSPIERLNILQDSEVPADINLQNEDTQSPYLLRIKSSLLLVSLTSFVQNTSNGHSFSLLPNPVGQLHENSASTVYGQVLYAEHSVSHIII